MTARRRRGRSDRGSAVVEVTIAAPALVLILGFAIFVGRMGSVTGDVEQAARDAARAASLRSTPALAQSEATAAASLSLSGGDTRCASVAVSVSPGLARGGAVTARVTCTISLASVLPLVPGSRQVVGEATVPIDLYRAGDP